MYFYLKALHIIFVVTWFAGLFYIVRLLIYNTEAGDKPKFESVILRDQFSIMIKRLWYGITWPSAVVTLCLGLSVWHLLGVTPKWLSIKLTFVVGLYLYHFSLDKIVRQQLTGVFKYSSGFLRLWNEVATIFLVAIVMLVVVKQELSFLWGLLGLGLLVVLLLLGIKVYKNLRAKE